MCQIENELTIKGYYIPSFLHLCVNTDDDLLNIDSILRNNFSTFFHEYIHFYQDISTSYGMMNSILVIEYIKHMNVQMKEMKNFLVPLKTDDRWNTKKNDQLKDIYYGSGKLKPGNKINLEDIIKNPVKIDFHKGSSITVYEMKLFYKDYINNDAGDFIFGAKCIKESMAHFGQSILFPETTHDDVPYLIVDLIIDKYCKKISGNKILKFAICDASLMTFHPAETLFDKLLEIDQDSNFNPESPDDIYRYFFRDDIFFDGHIETTNSLFEKLMILNKEGLFDTIKADIYEDNRKWLNIMFEKARFLRSNNSLVFYELFSLNRDEQKEKFKTLIADLGSPFITNKKWDGTFFLPAGFTITTEFFSPYSSLGFLEFFLLMRTGQKKCVLLEFCKKSDTEDLTDTNCNNSPWLRCEKKDLCPFGTIWRTWDLTSIYPSN